jgi:hypothetical protein
VAQIPGTSRVEHQARPGAALYYELDLEPKSQVSGGEPWRNIDATPLVEFYPNSFLELTGEVTVGRTRQGSEEKSWELTPRIGVRFHLFERVWDEIHPERLPLARLYFANLSRIEYRNLWYSGDRPSSHETRFRNRTEFKLAINNPRLSVDDTWYLFMDVEFFVPLGDDVPERFATKRRFRGGFGYRLRPQVALRDPVHPGLRARNARGGSRHRHERPGLQGEATSLSPRRSV